MSASKNSTVFRRERGVPWTSRSLGCGIVAFFLFSAGLISGSLPPGEYDVKAVYLLNFGKFVTWPAQDEGQRASTFPICVLGQDPFGPALDNTMAGERLGGSSVSARRIQTPQQALECRILFVSRSEGPNLRLILETLGNAPVLTVSDLPDFARRGGMIQFVLQDDRVRFSVNLDSANRAGLTFSSQLLKVASSVHGKPPSGDGR